MAKRTEKTRFSALEAAEICTRRLSDTSDQELSEPESDVSAVDSVEEEMFFEGLDAILDRQNDSDPDWEPDTEVLAEVHVEIDDPELTSVPAAEPEPGPSSKIPRVEKTAKRGRGRRRGRGRGRGARPSSPSTGRWNNTEVADFTPTPLPFCPTRTPGPQLISTSDYTCLELFQLFFYWYCVIDTYQKHKYAWPISIQSMDGHCASRHFLFFGTCYIHGIRKSTFTY
ncbi:uncharacterized protein LOC129408420 isoform X2 [Boleophthalmus pectinirostris]|uniref:uncharacterized protein LOC129408420 isoform X2 n=1 Tax=Boleophthalmus pectinirostris TaxID=150288 RepID=UPI00242B5C2B|nr:uncharacterized protein LOC129408420 isoform X2 [Boleophthalmus pectinirostris]